MSSTSTLAPTMLTPREAAHVIGVELSTLNAWTAAGYGPPRHKLGPHANSPVRFDPQELRGWVLSHDAYGRRT